MTAAKIWECDDLLSDFLSPPKEHFYHGNMKSAIDADFVDGADHKVLENAATTFKGLLTEGASTYIGSFSLAFKVYLIYIQQNNSFVYW